MGRNNEGQSVASMWGEMVSAAQRGEVVMVADKFGNDVAVMLSKDAWLQLEFEVRSLLHVGMVLDRPDDWTPDIAFDDIVWPD